MNTSSRDNIEYNRSWNIDFRGREEEWSKPWGGSKSQWYGSLLYRLHDFLPAGTILEIAPGYGRWTQYLVDLCNNLIIVDLNEKCIEGCKERFSQNSKISYHVNDGKSLDMVADRSVDFVFSFDSMVHVDSVVLRAYLEQLAYKLKPNGIGFFHHSNCGEYNTYFQLTRRIPARIRTSLFSFIDDHCGRDRLMTSDLFEQLCIQSGMKCISQELINWNGKRLIDCFSTFALKDSICGREKKIIRNYDFMKEASLIRKISCIYGSRVRQFA